MDVHSLLIDPIPTVHQRKTTKRLDTKFIPRSVRKILEYKEARDIDTLGSTHPTTPPKLPPLQPSSPKFSNNYEITQQALDPPRISQTAPQEFKKVPKVLYFPVLRAIETDRGAHHHHSKKEVQTDPFLKTILPGEAGLMSSQNAVIRDLLAKENPNHLQYEKKFIEEKATRHDINVQVSALYDQTADFIDYNCLDYATGQPREMWTNNRALNRLETIEAKLDYLHTVFMWLVQGCWSREMWDGSKEDLEALEMAKQMARRKSRRGTELLQNTIVVFGGAVKIKSEKNKLIEDMKPPKPIPPGDVRSVGSQIRRKEAAALKNPDIPACIRMLLKNEKHGDGATLEEIQRVRKILKYEHARAKIGRDILDFRENLVTPDSKNFADWVRDEEGKYFEPRPETADVNAANFSVREFISGFLKIQADNALLYGVPGTPGITVSGPTPPGTPKTPRFSTTRRKTRVSLVKDVEVMTSNPILFARRRSGSHLRDSTTSKPLSFTTNVLQKERTESVMRRKSSFAIGAGNRRTSTMAERSMSTYSRSESVIKLKMKRRKSSLHNTVKPLKTPAEIIAYKVPNSSLWNLFHDEIVLILKKTAWDRTNDEITILFNLLRCQPAFAKMSDFVVKEVCGSSLVYREFSRNEYVFKQNEMARAWHIILSGSVSVMKTYTGDLKDEVRLRSLHPGNGFGDIGLMNDSIRTASILTNEYCEIIEISKVDYNRVIKASHRRSQDEVANFLKSMHLFSEWKHEALQIVASVMWLQVFEESQLIIKEGDPCKEIFFIKDGAVVLYKQIQYNNRPIQVRVAILGARTILCTEAIILQEESNAKKTASTTLPAPATSVATQSSVTDPNNIAGNPLMMMMPHHQTPSNRNSRFTIKAATRHDRVLLQAAYNLQLSDPVRRKTALEEGMAMDLREDWDFSKLETEDWVYEDLGDVVAMGKEKEMREIRHTVKTDTHGFSPEKRVSMRGVVKPVHDRKGVVSGGGVTLVASSASTARLELRELGASNRLLAITDEECVRIYEEEEERKQWRKFKKESMTSMLRETKADCKAEYNCVVGEKMKANTDLWR
ncbi:Cyclic nucleotide-binding domain-containing protein 2 [Rhizoclosmatium sp. JEL0117]|nr:Cyclic nucleotide-binding domain-containing protein 2 [Rhizoclosmatium sp. JEL0117]